MGSYPPPPPPPPPPPGYGAGYDRQAWKAQRRMAQAQARAARAQFRVQRAQMRMQQRSLRRRSIVGPLVLLALGIVLLFEQTGRLSWAQSLAWYARWWPVVLIVAGIILMIEWLFDQQSHEDNGQPPRTHVLGAGMVLLLILLGIIGWSARWSETGAAWRDHYLRHDLGGLDHVFGESHESDASLSYTLPAGASLVIHDPMGAVTVTGSSTDGQVHLSVHKEVYAWRDSDAEARARQMQPAFSTQGSNLMLDMKGVAQGQADLTIEVPHTVPLTVNANHGDVHVSELHAPLTIAANSGDLDLSGVDGPVTAHVNNDDASVTARSITGSFALQGRAGDITLSNIDGAVTLQGDFFGTTHAEQINGALRFETSRTRLSVARIDGTLDVENDDLQANRLLGPVILTTRNRTIEFDDVSGPVQVTNRNGSVSVTSAAPLGPINIRNEHGSVDIGVPANSSFALDAQTRNGSIENDFNLQPQSQQDQHWLTAAVGSGGPKVQVATSDGDITIRKSIAPPVPPTPPAPPKISMTPAAPQTPSAPASSKPAKRPRASKPAAPPSAAPASPPQPAPATDQTVSH